MSERKDGITWYDALLLLASIVMLMLVLHDMASQTRDLQRRVGQLESER